MGDEVALEGVDVHVSGCEELGELGGRLLLVAVVLSGAGDLSGAEAGCNGDGGVVIMVGHGGEDVGEGGGGMVIAVFVVRGGAGHRSSASGGRDLHRRGFVCGEGRKSQGGEEERVEIGAGPY